MRVAPLEVVHGNQQRPLAREGADQAIQPSGLREGGLGTGCHRLADPQGGLRAGPASPTIERRRAAVMRAFEPRAAA